MQPVLIPLLNPNEPDALLAALFIQPGQQVQKGDVLCTLETTKAAADIYAEEEGFVVGLRLAQGQAVRAGEVLCYLAPTPDEAQVESAATSVVEPSAAVNTAGNIEPAPAPSPTSEIPPGLRITQPALALARQHSLDLTILPTGKLVTEKMLQELLGNSAGIEDAMFSTTGVEYNSIVPNSGFSTAHASDKEQLPPIVIYGGGGHSKTLIEMLRASKTYHLVGVIDDHLPSGEEILGVPVLGDAESLPCLKSQGIKLAVNAVGSIGNIEVRIAIFQRLAQAGFSCPALVHPAAYIEPSAALAPGIQVFAHAYVGSEARLGYGAIINTGAVVSHDCQIGNYANISPGALLAGAVEVGKGALVGMGVTIHLGVKIGAGARIGNSAVIKADVPAKTIVMAGRTWPE